MWGWSHFGHPHIWYSVRIDWEAIKASIDDQDVILIINHRVAAILAALWHTLGWEATYRIAGYDYADWDYLQRLLSESEENIGSPLPLSDLLTILNNIYSAIDQLEAIAATDDCCTPTLDFSGGADYTDVVLDGVGDVPANIVTAGYASSSSDWPGYAAYKCMIGHLIVTEHQNKILRLSQLFDSGGNFAGTVASILAGIAVVATFAPPTIALIVGAGVGLALWEAITEVTASALTDWISTMETNRDRLVCAIVNSDGNAAAASNYAAEIEDLFSPANALALNSMMMDVAIKAWLGGRYAAEDLADKLADAGYDVGDYTCDCDEVPANTYEAIFRFSSNDEGWVESSADDQYWDASNGNPAGCLSLRWSIDSNDQYRLFKSTLEASPFSWPNGSFKITKLEFDWLLYDPSPTGDHTRTLLCRGQRHSDGAIVQFWSHVHTAGDESDKNTWFHVRLLDADLTDDLLADSVTYPCLYFHDSNSVGPVDLRWLIDNVRIWGYFAP